MKFTHKDGVLFGQSAAQIQEIPFQPDARETASLADAIIAALGHGMDWSTGDISTGAKTEIIVNGRIDFLKAAEHLSLFIHNMNKPE